MPGFLSRFNLFDLNPAMLISLLFRRSRGPHP